MTPPLKFFSLVGWLAILWAAFSSPATGQNKTLGPISVNQLGYLPQSPKIALVSSPLPLGFEVIDTQTERTVHMGRLRLAETHDATSGSNLWQADFSPLQTSGTYKLSIDGIGESFAFPIAAGVYNALATNAVKAFYYLRSGAAIEPPYSPFGRRAAAHLEDGRLYAGDVNHASPYPAQGGWYDGSDLGNYVINGVAAAGTLLLLHERLPHAFPDNSLNIPESGNQVPDILDQVRWELEWLLRMQDADGGVHHKLTGIEPVLGVPPKEDKNSRFVFAKSTAATAGTCALLAKASRLYSPHDATFATACLQAAQKAWRYLEEHPNDQGFQNPQEVLTEAYTDPDDSDERFWAAVELYLAADDLRYANLAAVIADRRVPLLSTSGYWGNVMPLAFGTIIQNVSNENRFPILGEVKEDLLAMAQTFHQRSQREGFRVSLKDSQFVWGSNAALLQNALVLLLADTLRPEAGYRLTALDHLHYVLGRNPLSRSFVTGFGSRSPQNPHNLRYLLDDGKLPIPGLLVGGANGSLNDRVLKSQFSAETPPALAYRDEEASYASNEISLNWNAALAFVATHFMHEAGE